MEGIYVTLVEVCYFVNLESDSILSFDETTLGKSMKSFSSFLSPFSVLLVVPLLCIFLERDM